MTTLQPDLIRTAKQGDVSSIAALINRALQPKGIKAIVRLNSGCLEVRLISEEASHTPALVEFIRRGVVRLNIAELHTLEILGYRIKNVVPIWRELINLQPALETMQQDSLEDEYQDRTDEGNDVEMPDGIINSFPYLDLINWLDLKNWVQQNRIAAFAVILLPLSVLGFFWLSKHPTTVGTPIQPTPTPTVSAMPGYLSAVETGPPNVSQSRNRPTNPDTTLDEAFERAMSAAVDTQTAETKTEWESVILNWEEAIAQLEQISNSDINYAIAQQKIGEYQRNLDYAQQRAEQSE